VKIAQITDGTSNTLLLGERAQSLIPSTGQPYGITGDFANNTIPFMDAGKSKPD
jgi:hypothetical protein